MAREPVAARFIGGTIGRVSSLAARRPLATLVLVLALTAVPAYGLMGLQFEENLLQILPRGNPNTEANLNVSEEFPGHHTYTALILKIDEEKWARANEKLPHRMPPEQMQEPPYQGANNISDEVYIRGMEELYRFYRDRAPEGVEVFAISWNSHVKLVNWSNEKAVQPAGTDVDYAFSVPGTDPQGSAQYALDWQTVMQVAPGEVVTQASPDWSVMRAVYTYEYVDGTEPERISDLGGWFHETTLEYKAAAKNGELEWDVFDSESLNIFDSKVVVDDHQNDLAQSNLMVLGPLVGVFVFASLWLAFRTWKPILVGSATLVLGVTWTYGLMGHLDIPLNVLNLTVVPLILGVGIDFSIHIVNEFLHLKSDGKDDVAAWREAGYASGFAMFVATVTTIVGLVVMVFSPSLLIAQLGLVAALSLAIVYCLVVIFVPAAFTALGTDGVGNDYRPSKVMPTIAGWLGRRRAVTVILVVLLTAGLVASTSGLYYETFGNPAQNFPEGDPVRGMQDRALMDLFGRPEADVGSNWVIIEGDITNPEVHEYIMGLQRDLAASEYVRSDSVVSVTNLLARWVAIKGGSHTALVNILQEGAEPGSTYPSTQQDIEQNLDEIYGSPFATYASLFINRDYGITVILVDLRGGTTYEEATAAWDEVWGIIEQHEANRPADVQVSLGGYTAFSYLFITYEMPWVTYMAIVTNIVVVALVALLTFDWRATLLVGVLNLLTSVWWLGVLPHLGIGLAITLTMPLVFIYCIGSDYGLHLAWSMKRGHSVRATFGTVGKAVLFSALTDFGAFALFTPMENLMMRRSMIATAVAILMIFLATMLIVPLFYRDREEATPVRESTPAAEGAAAGGGAD